MSARELAHAIAVCVVGISFCALIIVLLFDDEDEPPMDGGAA